MAGEQEDTSHTRIGYATLILGLAGVASAILLWIVLFLNRGFSQETGTIVFEVFVFGSFLTAITGVILGFCGVAFQEQSRNLLPISGGILSFIAVWLVFPLAQDIAKTYFFRYKFPFHAAAGDGDTQNVRKFIENGVKINERGPNGWTPLHHAVSDGHHDTTRILLKNEANPNAKTTSGETPLHIAVQRYQKQLVRLLLKHGASRKRKNEEGLTPYEQAEQYGLEEMKQILSNRNSGESKDKQE